MVEDIYIVCVRNMILRVFFFGQLIHICILNLPVMIRSRCFI